MAHAATAATVEDILARRAPGLAGGMPVPTAVIETPMGPMLAAATESGVCLLEFPERRALSSELKDLSTRLDARFVPAEAATGEPGAHHLALLARELLAYFAGTLREFTVPQDTPGTEFDRRVWDHLRRIPYGRTVSYGSLAARLGKPGASRAVGRANGRNRVAIVVPCHRVIQEDGTLGGYGGGLERKRALLELEGSLPAGESGRLFA